MRTDCLLGLGANAGDRALAINRATDQLAALADSPLAASDWCESAAAGGPAGQPAFLNGAVRFDCRLSPEELLRALHEIERLLGRRRDAHWGPRTIDLDLLLYGQHVVTSRAIEVPHPRMAFRRFVLAPAAQIAGEMIHPPTNRTVADLLARLDATPRFVAISGPQTLEKTEFGRRIVDRIGGRLVEVPAETRAESLATSEVETLADRTEAEIAQYPAAWIISDFWLPELASQGEGPAKGRHKSWPDPRLVISLGTGKGRLDVADPDTSPLLHGHDGPLLNLAAAALDAAVDESAAAIAAMEESSILGWLPRTGGGPSSVSVEARQQPQ